MTIKGFGLGLLHVVLRVLGLVFLALAFWFLYEEKEGAGLAIVGGCVCLVLPHLAAMAEFEFGLAGIKGKMREVIAEAKASVTQLHDLAATLGEVIIHQMAAGGRFGGMDAKKQDEIRQKVIDLLEKLDLPDDRVKQVERADEDYVRFDYVGYVIKPITQTYQNELDEEQEAGFKELLSQHSLASPLSPVQLRTGLAKLGVLAGEMEQRLLDYEHYCRTYKHRRPDSWTARRQDLPEEHLYRAPKKPTEDG